jgi:hypothetical protein
MTPATGTVVGVLDPPQPVRRHSTAPPHTAAELTHPCRTEFPLPIADRAESAASLYG